MKKLFSIFLSLSIMVIMASSCGTLGASEAIVGEWTYNIASDSAFLDSVLQGVGVNVTFHEDGSLVGKWLQDPISGTWDKTGEENVYTAEVVEFDISVDIEVAGDTLVWTSNGEEVVFTRVKSQENTDEKIEETPQTNESEQISLSDPLQEAVSVQVIEKNNFEENINIGRYQPFVELVCLVTNHTDKEIQGVQGTLEIQDLFGEIILGLQWDFVGQNILPGEDIIERDYGLQVNEFMNEHVEVYSTDIENLQFVYTVEKIVFTDGSVM